MRKIVGPVTKGRSLGNRVRELRERVRELEEWNDGILPDSDKKHKRGQRQRIAETNPVWWILIWIMTILAGLLLGLTILTLVKNIALQLFQREYCTSHQRSDAPLVQSPRLKMAT
jgi:hypothetical protein